MAIAPMARTVEETASVYCLELPKGDRHGELNDALSWGVALDRIRAAASGQSPLLLESVAEVSARAFRSGALNGAVDSVLQELCG